MKLQRSLPRAVRRHQPRRLLRRPVIPRGELRVQRQADRHRRGGHQGAQGHRPQRRQRPRGHLTRARRWRCRAAPRTGCSLAPARCPRTCGSTPDGKRFLVADMLRNGVWVIDAPHPQGRAVHPHRHGRARDLPLPGRPPGLRLQPRRRAASPCSTRHPRDQRPCGRSRAAARRTWAASPPTAPSCGSPVATTPWSTSSTPRPGKVTHKIHVDARPARPVRLAAAGPVQPRPHRQHALTRPGLLHDAPAASGRGRDEARAR